VRATRARDMNGAGRGVEGARSCRVLIRARWAPARRRADAARDDARARKRVVDTTRQGFRHATNRDPRD
jgi:hypothetical protein